MATTSHTESLPPLVNVALPMWRAYGLRLRQRSRSDAQVSTIPVANNNTTSAEIPTASACSE